MTDPVLELKLNRITGCAFKAKGDEPYRSLLHAYTACLTAEELCKAAVLTLDAPAEVRSAIRNRLLRLCRGGIGASSLDRLAHRLLDFARASAHARVRADALMSHLYSFLDTPTRRAVLEHWRGRGTSGAGARWLKAVADDDSLFRINDVLDYWRTSGDFRAAKLLAYRAEPTLLAEILPELVRKCGEGWIISRAALRAASISEENWTRIRAAFPASYAYLCANTDRPLGEADALALVLEAETRSLDEGGLAIWATGQLGLWSVLEQIEAAAPDLRERRLARMGLTGTNIRQKQPKAVGAMASNPSAQEDSQ